MKQALIGYGGHAREVIAQIGKNLPYFVDDEFLTPGSLPLAKFDPNKYEVIVAIGDSKTRKNIVDKLPLSTKFFTFIHPTVLIVGENIKIGEGSFIGAYSILTTNIKLGKHSLLNRSNHIGHDSIIGDYFSAMPGAIVSGNVNIGNKVYIGTNSSIREKINICNNVTIGLNSGVIKDINQEGTYVGLPTKKIN